MQTISSPSSDAQTWKTQKAIGVQVRLDTKHSNPGHIWKNKPVFTQEPDGHDLKVNSYQL